MKRSATGFETRLSNQGIVKGSEAYDRELERLDQSRNDAYTQLLLQGRGQATQEALTARNQPINEIIGLMNGSQINQPQFVPTGSATIPTADNAGIIQQNYRDRLNIWQQEAANRNNLLGGLFGLGRAFIGRK